MSTEIVYDPICKAILDCFNHEYFEDAFFLASIVNDELQTLNTQYSLMLCHEQFLNSTTNDLRYVAIHVENFDLNMPIMRFKVALKYFKQSMWTKCKILLTKDLCIDQHKCESLNQLSPSLAILEAFYKDSSAFVFNLLAKICLKEGLAAASLQFIEASFRLNPFCLSTIKLLVRLRPEFDITGDYIQLNERFSDLEANLDSLVLRQYTNLQNQSIPLYFLHSFSDQREIGETNCQKSPKCAAEIDDNLQYKFRDTLSKDQTPAALQKSMNCGANANKKKLTANLLLSNSRSSIAHLNNPNNNNNNNNTLPHTQISTPMTRNASRNMPFEISGIYDLSDLSNISSFKKPNIISTPLSFLKFNSRLIGTPESEASLFSPHENANLLSNKASSLSLRGRYEKKSPLIHSDPGAKEIPDSFIDSTNYASIKENSPMYAQQSKDHDSVSKNSMNKSSSFSKFMPASRDKNQIQKLSKHSSLTSMRPGGSYCSNNGFADVDESLIDTSKLQYKNPGEIKKTILENIVTVNKLVWIYLECHQCINQNSTKKALLCLKQLPKRHQKSNFANYMRFLCKFYQRKFEKSIRCYNDLLANVENWTIGIDLYASALAQTQQFNALSLLSLRSKKWCRLQRETWVIVANLFSLKKEHQLAIAMLQRALELSSTYDYAYFLIANEYFEMKKPDQAIYHYQRAIELDSYNFRYWYGLGTLHIAQCKFEEATHSLKRALHLNKSDHMVLLGLAIVHQEQHDFECSNQFLSRILVLKPDCTKAHFHLAKNFYWMSQYAHALEHCHVLEMHQPDCIEVLALAHIIHKAMGDQSDAFRYYTAAKTIDADKFNMLHNEWLKSDKDLANSVTIFQDQSNGTLNVNF